MSVSQVGRILISHKFDICAKIYPELTRDEFAQVFIDGFSNYSNINVRQITNPHWMVEIVFSLKDFKPSELGKICAQCLAKKRLAEKPVDSPMPDILVLGGIKTTPNFSNSPEALQTGDWGLDLVETESAALFINKIKWKEITAEHLQENVFKIELKGK